MATKKLTEKQRRFVDAYLSTGNSAKAARQAGYSERTAYSIGNENLRKPEVQKAIDARRKAIDAGKVADARERRESITKVLRDNARDGNWQAVLKAADILNKMDNLYTQRIEAKTDGVMDVRVMWGGETDDEDDKD